MADRTSVETRELGRTGIKVFPMALGCMGMSPGMYGAADETESIATIHAAIDAGVTLIDTGDFYGSGHNEILIGQALKGRRDRALLSVKFGAMRTPEGGWGGFDGRPAAVKNFAAYSLKRLGADHIDIYRPSRLDPAVPIEDTIGAITDLIRAGYVRFAGLSEVGPDTIRRAHAVHPVSDLQIEYSMISRGPEKAIFPALEELGIGVTAYGVLSRGLLSSSKPAEKGDFRAHLPRFTGDNFRQNQKTIEELNRLAAEIGLTPARLAIAWVCTKGRYIIPVIGARTRKQLYEALETLTVQLSAATLERIDRILSPSAILGARYDDRQMSVLDSEK